jgi:hypothetical protein
MISNILTPKFVRFLYIVIAILAAQGCSPSLYQYAVSLRESPELSPKEGIILVSVTHNHSMQPFESIHFTNIETKLKVIASWANVAHGLSDDTSVYIVKAPVGRYVISELSDSGRMYLRFHSSSLKEFSRQRKFVVSPGTVTDLGRIVITQTGFKQLIGYSKTNSSNMEFIRSSFPFYSNLLENKRRQGWETPDNSNKGAIEKFAINFPTHIYDAIELNSGHIIAATNMGSFLVRNPGGKWKWFTHTKDLNPVLALATYESKDSVFVAGGEFSTFVKVNSKGNVTKIDRGNLPMGKIVFIDHNKNYSRWYVGIETNTKGKEGKIHSTRSLYQSNHLDSGVWEKLASYENFVGYYYQKAVNEDVRFFKFRQGFGILSGKDNSMTCFNSKDNSQTTNQIPIPALKLSHMTVGAEGAIGIVKAKRRNLYTEDCGKTWVRTSRPDDDDIVTAPFLLPSKNLIQMLWNSWDGKATLWKSKEQGKEDTWQENSGFKGHPLYSSKNVGLLWHINGLSGYILRSTDEGKTWNLEYRLTPPDLQKKKHP